jgi:DNA polymerase
LPLAKISQVHGQDIWIKGRLIAPLYHPAAGLHQPSLRPVIEKDFAKLPELIAKAAEAPKYEEKTYQKKQEPKQLNLF